MFDKRFLLIIILVFTALTFLLGCNNEISTKENASDLKNTEAELVVEDIKGMQCYSTAEEFEAALNSGDDVEGAMVTFTAGITAPGPGSYNMYAGKKLAFISTDHFNINPGSIVTVKVKSVKNVEGIWNIEYER